MKYSVSHGSFITFEEEEIQKYGPLWSRISRDIALREQRKILAEKLPFADEIGLVRGTEPLLKELEPFSDQVISEAKKMNPSMGLLDLHNLVFFVLHIDSNVAERLENQQNEE